MKVGDDTVINVALPATGSNLVIGGPVTVSIQRSLVVSGTVACTPAPGVVCEKASWADVTIIPGDTSDPDNPDAQRTYGNVLDTCGFFNEDMTDCPVIAFDFGIRELGGPGLPPAGDVGSPYFSCIPTPCQQYRFRAGSSIAEGITFSHDGPLPPGLTLQSDGLLSGTPTETGTDTFTVIAKGTTSGTTRSVFVTVSVFD